MWAPVFLKFLRCRVLFDHGPDFRGQNQMEILVFASVVTSIFGIFGVFFKNALWDPLAHHLATKPLPLASGTLRGQEG